MRLLAVMAAALALWGAWGCRRASPGRGLHKTPAGPAPLSQAIEIEAEYAAAQLSNDPDDPAIWVHPDGPARSLIIGTMKPSTARAFEGLRWCFASSTFVDADARKAIACQAAGCTLCEGSRSGCCCAV